MCVKHTQKQTERKSVREKKNGQVYSSTDLCTGVCSCVEYISSSTEIGYDDQKASLDAGRASCHTDLYVLEKRECNQRTVNKSAFPPPPHHSPFTAIVLGKAGIKYHLGDSDSHQQCRRNRLSSASSNSSLSSDKNLVYRRLMSIISAQDHCITAASDPRQIETNRVPASAGGKGGILTSVWWQVTLTLCDPIMACKFPVAVKAKLMLNCYTLFTLHYFTSERALYEIPHER